MAFTGSHPVRFEAEELPEDAYRLVITANEVTVYSGSYGGAFYALITLLTLLRYGPLPCGEIVDTPRYG